MIFEAILLTIITASTPLVIASLGELVTERAGVLNHGVEGMMTMGAVGAFAVAQMTGSPYIGVLAGIVSALDKTDLGIDPHGILTARVGLFKSDFPLGVDQVRQFEKITDRLRADAAVPYGELMGLMNLIRRAGFTKVALIGVEASQ